MADVELDNDPDPIRATYEVFIKPHLSADRQMYVLQFPNRDSRQQYKSSQGSEPLKMRIKPKVGMVELDVPMDVHHNYDQRKGATWGSAMKKSRDTKGTGSHGLPGGFGIGGAAPGGRGAGRGRGIEDVQALQDQILADFSNAVAREQVLVKQTLGGQSVSNEETTPQYMIGTFVDDQLHLTPVDNVVQMRPQFHHIDAQAEQERASRGRDLGPRPAAESRAVHMTVKTNVDGEEDSTDSMAARIQSAQSEEWKSHRFVDEDTGECWEGYQANLFAGADGGFGPEEERLDRLPRLLSTLGNAEYLDEISAPNDAAKLSRSQKLKKGKGKGRGKATEQGDGAESDTLSAFTDPSISDTDEEADAPASNV